MRESYLLDDTFFSVKPTNERPKILWIFKFCCSIWQLEQTMRENQTKIALTSGKYYKRVGTHCLLVTVLLLRMEIHISLDYLTCGNYEIILGILDNRSKIMHNPLILEWLFWPKGFWPYPHMNLNVSDFCIANSTLVVLHTGVHHAVVFEHLGQGVKPLGTIGTLIMLSIRYVAPSVSDHPLRFPGPEDTASLLAVDPLVIVSRPAEHDATFWADVVGDF